jgi:outer membrane lipoprotein LolB
LTLGVTRLGGPPPLRRRLRLALLALPVLGALGCAHVPAPDPITSAPTGATLSGRLALNVAASAEHEAQAISAAFELRGNAATGGLDLSTPLGTLIATARWSPSEVLLTVPQGAQRFASLDELTRKLLGEPLPLPALFDWLRGQPWAEAAPAQDMPPAGFRQIGWEIDLARLDEGWVRLHRSAAPEITLRARLDR